MHEQKKNIASQSIPNNQFLTHNLIVEMLQKQPTFKSSILPRPNSFAFDEYFVKAFWRWGLLVHCLRWPLLLLPFLLTGILSVGFVWIEKQTTRDPLFVFSPENARWRFERAVLTQHWPLDEQHFWPGKSYDYNGYVDVIAAGRRRKSDFDPEGLARPNILLSGYLNELERINQYTLHNLTVPLHVPNNNQTLQITFTDLCMSYAWKCYENEHITMLQPKGHWTGGLKAEIVELAKDIIENEVKITYPIGWRGTEPLYFGALVGGVHLTDSEGHFDYASAIRLTYNVRDGNLIGEVSESWRKKLTEFLINKEEPASDLLEFGLYHNMSLPEGLQDVADTLMPKFGGCILVLFLFCMGCSIVLLSDASSGKQSIVGIDWTRSKPLLGLAALLCPLLATLSAFGLLLWTGCLYNAIVNVSPFICLSIGIDDAFLMTAAWHRTSPELKTPKRLAEALAEAAVAISITSFTDMLTFGIGCFTTLPGVRLFCMYTFAGVTFTYIYQITYFAAAMAFAGEMEEKGQHSIFPFFSTINLETAKTTLQRLMITGSPSRGEAKEAEEKISWLEQLKKCWNEQKMKNKIEDKELSNDSLTTTKQTFVNRLFREVYGPFLLNKNTKLYVFLCYSLYILFAFLGVSHMEEGLHPKELVRSSFYLTDFYVLIDETFWKEGLQLQVVVNNPPDFVNFTQRQRLNQLVSSLEGTQFTMQHNATMFWLDAFDAKIKEDKLERNISEPKTLQEWHHRCLEWLLTAGGRRLWELDMHWIDGHLVAFRFQIGLRNYRTPIEHTNGCRLMRSIADQFTEFNVTTFHEYYPFSDQYIELKPALYRNCLIAVLCMGFIALLMIPSWPAAFFIIAAIVSIDIGVIGYMSLWGVNLESVSMITIIMSIGFSVDLSAHITYAFVKAPSGLSSDERAIAALETLGWPVFLGAFSTVVGIMVLTLVDAVIILIFFKTVFLVIIFSLLHGIVFLPILLTVAMPNERVCQNEDERI